MNDALLFRHPEADPESLVLSHELRCIETTFDAGASFAVPVPRAMVTARPAQHVPEREGRPMPLAIFGQPPALDGARLLVSTQTLRWEVDPLEWLRWSWARDGWRIALAKRHPGSKGPRYELGALREREGRAEVRRTMATRSGARLMRCDAMAPLDVWSQHHDALWHAIDGFRMGQSAAGTVEALVAHDGPLLGFALPGSWDARGHGGAQRMMWGAQLADDAQRGAVLKVQAQPQSEAPSAQARRDALWRELKADGVQLGSVLAAERAEFAKAVPGWLGQWQTSMEHNGRPSVVVLVQREDAGVVLDYLLMAPAAGTEHLDWMRATRALDVAIATSLPRLKPAA